MRKIKLKDAKAKLSTVVDEARRGKPSVITRHGKPEAVILGFADWERLSRVPSFGRLLMSAPLEDGDLPQRNRAPVRVSARCRVAWSIPTPSQPPPPPQPRGVQSSCPGWMRIPLASSCRQ